MKKWLDILSNTHEGFVLPAVGDLYHKAIGSDFIRKVMETFGTRVLLIGVGLATSVIVARILGPERCGLYALAVAIGAIGVQLGNLGLHASNTYYVAKDRELLPTLVSNSLLVSFGFGGLGAVLAWAVFSLWPSIAPVEGPLLALALVWIPFGLAYMLLQGLLLGIQEVRTYNKVELASKVFGVAFIGLVILFGMVAVETVFFVGLIALIVSLAWALWRLRGHVPRLPLPSFVLFRNNFGFGVKAYTSAFIAFLVFKADLFLINHYLGPEDAGLYSVAVSLTNMINLFPVVVGSLFFPKLCAMNDWGDRLKFVRKVFIGVGIIMLPATLMAALVSDVAIATLFGRVYAGSAIPFRWLMPGVFFLSVESMLRRLLISDGYRIEVVYVWVITFTTNIVLNILMIPRVGTKGAALASSASMALLAALTILLVRRFVIQITSSQLSMERERISDYVGRV